MIKLIDNHFEWLCSLKNKHSVAIFIVECYAVTGFIGYCFYKAANLCLVEIKTNY